MRKLCLTQSLGSLAAALLLITGLTGLTGLAPATASAQSMPTSNQRGIEQLRTQVQEYTELQRIIAEATSQWKVDQSFLGDTIELLTLELDSIESRLDKFKDTGNKTGEKIGTLEDRKEELLGAADTVGKAIVGLEEKIKKLVQRFPPPLVESMAPLLRRIPDDPNSPKAPAIGQRLQNVVGILSVAEKFNTSLHSFGEMQTIEGKQQQVATIYLGLAASFSINSDADVATVGYPTGDGWEMESRPELAPAIKRFLESYDGVRDPEFVPLSVEIR